MYSNSFFSVFHDIHHFRTETNPICTCLCIRHKNCAYFEKFKDSNALEYTSTAVAFHSHTAVTHLYQILCKRTLKSYSSVS